MALVESHLILFLALQYKAVKFSYCCSVELSTVEYDLYKVVYFLLSHIQSLESKGCNRFFRLQAVGFQKVGRQSCHIFASSDSSLSLVPWICWIWFHIISLSHSRLIHVPLSIESTIYCFEYNILNLHLFGFSCGF